MNKRLSSSYSSSLEGSSLDGESLIFSCSHLLFSSYESSLFFFPDSAESNHFLLAHIPRMNEFMILGGHSRWLSLLLHPPFLLLPLQVVLHPRSSHSSIIFSNPSSDLCSSLQIAWSRNQTSLVSLGKTFMVQVDP